MSEAGTRILVVAAEEHVGSPLEAELERLAGGRDAEVKIVAPALAESRFEHAAGSVDDGIEDAQRRLGKIDEDLSHHELPGHPRVIETMGDADPILAIDDALADFPADEIVIVTHPDDGARWLEQDAFDRAREHFGIPVVHFEAEGEVERSDGSELATERADARRDENMPGFSTRDLIGIFVAIVGTIALIAIASVPSSGLSENHDLGSFDLSSQVIRIAIAGVAALINIGNVVGLVLFNSVGYRGPWQRAFSYISLWGTLIAIPVALLV